MKSLYEKKNVGHRRKKQKAKELFNNCEYFPVSSFLNLKINFQLKPREFSSKHLHVIYGRLPLKNVSEHG